MIKEMIRALSPVIKDPERAEQILTRYWTDQKAIIWTIKQVYRAANERSLVLTKSEARTLLHKFTAAHNPQYGINWQNLLELIDDSGMGRKITRRELKQFLEHDVVAVQK